jgi:hypothetical protein
MARTVALVNTTMLEWARETAGYSVAEAAARAGRPESDLRSWESGQLSETAACEGVLRVYCVDTSAWIDLVKLYNPASPLFAPLWEFLGADIHAGQQIGTWRWASAGGRRRATRNGVRELALSPFDRAQDRRAEGPA